MTTIDDKEVRRVAALARIALTDQEVAQFAGELGVIADAVAKVKEVVSADIPPTSHPIPLSNVLREDSVAPVLTPEEALSGAPDVAEDQFLVPQILGEE